MPIHPRSLLFVLPLTLGWVNELFAQPADPTTYLPLQTTSGRNAAGATASKQTDFGIELGEEEYVLGPGPIPLDNPMFSVRNGSTAFIYSANGTTLVYVQPQIYPLTAAPKSALGPGPADSFDDCGAWLQSVSFPRAGGAVGWYHAETNCNYAL